MRVHRGTWSLFGKLTRAGPNDDHSKGALIPHVFDQEITLATNADTTTVAAAVPAGACLKGASCQIIDAITGVAADTTWTVKLGGGTVADFGTTRAAGTNRSAAVAENIQTDADLTIVFATGTAGDKTPSGGKVRVVMHYDTCGNL